MDAYCNHVLLIRARGRHTHTHQGLEGVMSSAALANELHSQSGLAGGRHARADPATQLRIQYVCKQLPSAQWFVKCCGTSSRFTVTTTTRTETAAAAWTCMFPDLYNMRGNLRNDRMCCNEDTRLALLSNFLHARSPWQHKWLLVFAPCCTSNGAVHPCFGRHPLFTVA